MTDDAVPVTTRSASRAAARPARSRAPPAVINAITDALGHEDHRHAGDAPGGVARGAEGTGADGGGMMGQSAMSVAT